MENTAKLSGGRKRFRLERAKVKLLASYYGHPARDLRLICITGTQGKTLVAHYVHEMLTAANQPAAILASETTIKASILHKFLNDAWKAKVTYAVVTAPVEALAKGTFYGLPVFLTALTDFEPSGVAEEDLGMYLDAKNALLQMNPEVVVLNRDDAHYPDFAQFRGKSETITYGASSDADLKIEKSKLYRKGTEATLSWGRDEYTVASFQTGEPVVGQMACAAGIGTALNLGSNAIIEGIANYES